MRRRLTRLAAILAVLAVLVGVGLWMLARSAPERVRGLLEENLEAALGTDVSVAEAFLPSDWPPAIEARRVEAWPGDEGPALSVPRARLELDLLALVTGRIEPRRLLLQSPTLRLVRAPDGSFLAPVRWAEPGSGGGSGFELGRQALAALVGAVLDGALPAERFDVRDGRVAVWEARGETLHPGLVIEALDARLRRQRSRETGSLQVRGDWVLAEHTGHLSGWAELDRHGESGVGLELEEVELEPVRPYLQRVGVQLEGRATGELELRLAPDRSHLLDADLEVAPLQLQLPDLPRVRVPSARLHTSLVLGESRLDLWSGGLAWDDLALELDGTLELPVRPEARLRLGVRAPRLTRKEVERALAWLPPALADRVRVGLEPLESGSIAGLELRLATALATFSSEEVLPLLARDLELAGRLENGTLRLERDTSLTGVGVEWHYDRGRLDLRGARATLAGQRLPRLDLTVSGLPNLLRRDELQCLEPARAPALPGWRALQDWMRARRQPGSPRSWSRLEVEADWVAHPVLLCVVENLQASVSPVDDGWDAEVQQASWAGAPVRGQASFRREPEETLVASLDLGPPWEPVSPVDPQGPWAAGTFSSQAERFGPWRIRGARGGFSLSGTRLALTDVHLELEPRAEVLGEGDLELGRAEDVRYRTRFRMENGSARHVLQSLGVEEEFVEGRVVAAGVLEGVLVGADSPIAHARGEGVVLGRDGVLHRRLPALLAIVMASDALASLSEREKIPYVAIDSVLVLEDGILKSRSLSVEGPWIRAVADGQVDMVGQDHLLEAVMAFYLFRNLDTVISKLPLLNRILLGEDENLINAYFALSGPFGQPEARLIPIKSLASGPASFVLEGFPAFVRGGLSRLRSVLLPGRSETRPPERGRQRADS
jgi:hypothetical protein